MTVAVGNELQLVVMQSDKATATITIGIQQTKSGGKRQMDVQEKHSRANAIAHTLRLIGILFFIAMAFQIITWKYAIFGGVACFIAAPAIKRIITGQ